MIAHIINVNFLCLNNETNNLHPFYYIILFIKFTQDNRTMTEKLYKKKKNCQKFYILPR